METLWIRFWLVVGLSLASSGAWATTYYISYGDSNFYDYDDYHDSTGLTGSITTNGKSGAIGAGDILSWSFALTAAFVGTNTLASSDPDSFFDCSGEGGCFFVSGNNLMMNSGTPDPHASFTLVPSTEAPHPPFVTFQDLLVDANAGCGHCDLFFQIGKDDIIGRAVPEPSSVFLLGIGLAAAFRVASKQTRDRQSTAV